MYSWRVAGTLGLALTLVAAMMAGCLEESGDEENEEPVVPLERTPTGAFTAQKIDPQNWSITIVVLKPSVALNKTTVRLIDANNTTALQRNVALMGNSTLYGTSQGIYFDDADLNGTLSAGDRFLVSAEEKSPLGGYSSLDNFVFQIIFVPNDEGIGPELILI